MSLAQQSSGGLWTPAAWCDIKVAHWAFAAVFVQVEQTGSTSSCCSHQYYSLVYHTLFENKILSPASTHRRNQILIRSQTVASVLCHFHLLPQAQASKPLISITSSEVHILSEMTYQYASMPSTTEVRFPSSTSHDYESDPVAAMTEYSRIMHSHTLKQMESARRASRRRDADSSAVSANVQLRKGDSMSSNSSGGSL